MYSQFVATHWVKLVDLTLFQHKIETPLKLGQRLDLGVILVGFAKTPNVEIRLK